jgi:thioredoxin 1
VRAALLERVSVEAFEGTQLSRPGTWVVGFLAGWCPFCREFKPELARLASRDGLSVLVVDLSDEDSPLWDRFRIRVVPTVIVFREGRPALRRDGRSGYGLSAHDLAAIRAAALGEPHPAARPPGP